MQLNTLNSIRKKTVLNEPTLPKMGHRILLLHHHLFIFGGALYQNRFNPIIHRLNIQTNQIQTLQAAKLTHLQGFALFHYGEFIYIWGGATPNSEILNSSFMSNGLLQFDGSKFTVVQQFGQIPSPRSFFAYTLFSNRYLLVCGGFDSIQFYNTWYVMDLKNFTWKKINISSQTPYSYRSTMKWSKGVGYILFQQAYLQNTDSFHQNLLYQFKFQNFRTLTLKLIPVNFSQQVKNLKVQFSNMCFLQNQININIQSNSLILFGGQKKFMKKHFSYHKHIAIYNFETLEWKLSTIDFQGSQFQAVYQKGKIFIVGGIRCDTQLFHVQILTINSSLNNRNSISQKCKQTQQQNQHQHQKQNMREANKLQIQNGLCYNCETIYGYKQHHSNFIIKNQLQPSMVKSKIQNKFLWKLSEMYRTPFQAIASLLDWFLGIKTYQILIKLNVSSMQLLNPNSSKSFFNRDMNFLSLQGFTSYKDLISFEDIQNCLLKGTEEHLCNIQLTSTLAGTCKRDKDKDEYQNQDLNATMNNASDLQSNYKNLQTICFFELKLASFRLGYSFLYVTFTKQNFISIIYISCIQLQSPQMIHKKSSVITYNIFWSKSLNKLEYSSQTNRHIIFQNVKNYFQQEEDYENSFYYFFQKQKNFQYKTSLFIFDCSELQKRTIYQFNIQKLNNVQKVQNVQDKNKSCFGSGQRKEHRQLQYFQSRKPLQKISSQHYYEYDSDIAIKSISKNNPQNSLIKYLEVLYLKKPMKITVEKSELNKKQAQFQNQNEQCLNPILKHFKQDQQRQKIKEVKLSRPKIKSTKMKNELQETHFTTMEDQSQIPIQSLQLFKSWKIYEIISSSYNEYKGIYFYINNRLIFVYQNPKLPCVQGYIELNEKHKGNELTLNKSQFSSLETEATIQKWISSLQGFLLQRRQIQQNIANMANNAQ